MKILHSENGRKGEFTAIEGDIKAGEMLYTKQDDVITITHTIGQPQFKGVGMELLNAAVTYAREYNFKIIPLCPFAKKMFDRHEALRDVLA